MQLKNLDHHIFALYYAQTESFVAKIGSNVVVEEKELHHRIVHVLRLSPGSSCVLFNKEYAAQVTLGALHKRDILVHIVAVSKNKLVTPFVRLLLPVLKRQSMVDAVYAAVETGVNEIQLIITTKVQRAWGGQKELERLQAVIVAACEQSKQYAIPAIQPPITLQQALKESEYIPFKVFYDAAGDSFIKSMQNILQSTVLLIGPEGDLTNEEKKVVQEHNFVSIHLTPTILRSPQAVAVGIGLLRALQ